MKVFNLIKNFTVEFSKKVFYFEVFLCISICVCRIWLSCIQNGNKIYNKNKNVSVGVWSNIAFKNVERKKIIAIVDKFEIFFKQICAYEYLKERLFFSRSF